MGQGLDATDIDEQSRQRLDKGNQSDELEPAGKERSKGSDCNK